jgi:hypothetical protein
MQYFYKIKFNLGKVKSNKYARKYLVSSKKEHNIEIIEPRIFTKIV